MIIPVMETHPSGNNLPHPSHKFFDEAKVSITINEARWLWLKLFGMPKKSGYLNDALVVSIGMNILPFCNEMKPKLA